MTILLNPHDLQRLIYCDHDAGYVALSIEGDSLTFTNINKALGVIDGETYGMTLAPAIAGMMTAKLTTDDEEPKPEPKDEPPVERAEAETKPWEPREGDDQKESRKGTARIEIGSRWRSYNDSKYYRVTRIVTRGPNLWPYAYLLREDQGAYKRVELNGSRFRHDWSESPIKQTSVTAPQNLTTEPNDTADEWTPQEWDNKQGRPKSGSNDLATLTKLGDTLRRERDGKSFKVVRLVEVGTGQGQWPIAYLEAADGERKPLPLSNVAANRYWTMALTD